MPRDNLREWSYANDNLGVTYCIGKELGNDRYEGVVAYYETTAKIAEKVSLDSGEYYKRLIYQGLPEEENRLYGIDDSQKISRIIGNQALDRSMLIIDAVEVNQFDEYFSNPYWWLSSKLASTEATAMAIDKALECFSSTSNLSLYGGSSFGLVDVVPKAVEDVDLLFTISEVDQLKQSITEYARPFYWSEVDPGHLLPYRRVLLKAKRWQTAQIRLSSPDPLTIDLKVARNDLKTSL